LVHWPRGIKARGELRTQFHHVIDVVPTILEACRVPEPKAVNGIPQKPIQGISMTYSFDDAKARSRRTTQYFEMFVNRALYHDGWVACSRFGVPWNMVGREGDFRSAPWELYHIEDDFSEADDLAAKDPEKLKQLQALFVEEAKKYDVFPLDSRMSERIDSRNRVTGDPRTSWTYFGNNVRLPEPIGPIIYPNSHTVTAELTIPEKGVEGVIACAGGLNGGWSIYVQDGKLTYHYNFADFEHHTVQARDPLPSGKATVKVEYTSKGLKPGGTINTGATVKLSVNGKPAGEGPVGSGMVRHGIEPFEVGRDSISPASPAYRGKGDFAFTGRIEKITFEANRQPGEPPPPKAPMPD
jgi:arylsulfatase